MGKIGDLKDGDGVYWTIESTSPPVIDDSDPAVRRVQWLLSNAVGMSVAYRAGGEFDRVVYSIPVHLVDEAKAHGLVVKEKA